MIIEYESNKFLIRFGEHDMIYLDDSLTPNDLISKLAKYEVTTITLSAKSKLAFDNLDENSFIYILINSILNASKEVDDETSDKNINAEL